MSVHEHYSGGWSVRWRINGVQRGRVFRKKADAEAFDRRLRERKRERTAKQALREMGPPRKLRQQVYVVGDGAHVKIGRSADVARRLIEMQTASPAELRLFWLIANDAGKLEVALHARYAAHRTRGEWYSAAPVLADVEDLAALGACHFERSGDPAVTPVLPKPWGPSR